MFSLLEKSPDNAVEVIRSELATHGLDEAWIEHIPFQHIVVAALESGSKFWPDLALDWVPYIGSSTQIVTALQMLHRHGRTQLQRHRAQKLLAKMRAIGD